jgi:hypothetical protein
MGPEDSASPVARGEVRGHSGTAEPLYSETTRLSESQVASQGGQADRCRSNFSQVAADLALLAKVVGMSYDFTATPGCSDVDSGSVDLLADATYRVNARVF